MNNQTDLNDNNQNNVNDNSVDSDNQNELQQKLEVAEQNYRRALADYQNLQRRTDDERRNLIMLSNMRLIKDILQILDDLYVSVDHINDSGLKSIILKFEKILKDEGVEEIKTEGEMFNPEIHEAIEMIDGEENKIMKTHRKGYMLSDRLIRPAIVAVGKPKS